MMLWNTLKQDPGQSVHKSVYMMILGQDRSVLVDTWWYWVTMGQYLVFGGTGSV